MNQQSSIGLQWKLTAINLAVSLLASALIAASFYLARSAGVELGRALALGIGAGLVTGVVGAYVTALLARDIKLRVWEASDMAGRIARGDLSARVSVAKSDELGVLEQQLNDMATHLENAVGELNRLAEQNRRLTEEAVRGAAVEERAKLARDLHDTVNQQLFVLTMRTAAARKRLERLGGEAGALVPELADLEELARGAHGQARELILQLRPTTLEQQGLGPALAEYVRAAGAKEGWTVRDEIDPSIRLGGSVGENLFRAAQEALNNVSKHAGARTVWVSLQRTEDGVLLRVKDDGQGFDLKADVRPTAVGMVGMQERVSQLGGHLRVRSAPGEGTELSISMPLQPEGGDRS